MGVDTADFDNSGTPGVAITNFDNEMIGLYHSVGAVPVQVRPLTTTSPFRLASA